MLRLPIDASLPGILDALAARSLVLVAPAGSGKTTRVPPAVLDSDLLSPDHPNVLVLQPRRIAARAAAARIAEERGWRLGDQVGYQVRFEKRFGPTTRLRFLTEGVLTRQLLGDPFLETVGAVILDEFHERNLNTDLALALVNEVRSQVRPDLIVVVMSATLDAEPVARFLGGCPVVAAQGRAYPVAVEYQPRTRPASAEAITPIVQELLEGPRGTGHILVFLPGLAEIRRLAKKLEPIADRWGALVLPLHGSLPAEDQDRALRPSERRKVVLSTNVAETSVTIDGVTVVVDSGLARTVHYNPDRAIDRWELKRISRAAADQRAGRAGRTGPGRCIRLWSEREQRGLDPFELPEIHRVDLSATVLALHAWGLRSAGQFGWFDPPASERLAAAENLLVMMEALDHEQHRITPLGEAMLTWPIHPRLARLMVAASGAGRSRDGATIAALLSERDILIRDGGLANSGLTARKTAPSGSSDILDRLDLLADAEADRFAATVRNHGIDPAVACQVARVRDELLGPDRLRRVANQQVATVGHDEDLLRWLLLAYPDRVAKRRGAEGTGLMVGGRGVRLGPQSVVKEAELFVALDAREERRGGMLEIQVNLASMVRAEWLEELFPHHMRRERVVCYDESRRRVVGSTRLFYQDLLLREDANASVDPTVAGTVLACALRPQAASIFQENPHAALWLARYEFLRRAVPELNWPDFDVEVLGELLERICQGKTIREQVEKTDFLPFLQSRLEPSLVRELREGAPETLTIPSGRHARLVYEPNRPPILAVRLQELFGWTETPRLARGRVPVLLHLLGPNYRPVQVTSDLRSFWATTYHQVRKDLRGRYPKHAWPEDPFQAQPATHRKRS
jgi:ATP-dependent helicase HrpB